MEARGTLVTLLLTDIEGSTPLWERAPQAMSRALVRHDDLADAIVAAHGGEVIKPRGEGDSLFVTMPDAASAVDCAVALQRAVAAEDWKTPGPLRLRIAVHEGVAEPRHADYVGTTVNRAARLRGIGHGGQILVSGAIARALDGDARLRALGAYRLRGLQEPEPVFQVCADGLRPHFPPLLTAAASALLERDDELEAIGARVAELVEHGTPGVVVVDGPAGIGKSSLLAEATAPERVGEAEVLQARGAELEGSLAFGAVRQLFTAAVLRLPGAERDTVLSGPAALSRPVLGLERAPAGGELTDPLHGLFWLAANLARRRPLILVVDDLHWLDDESARFVVHLARRVSETRILLLVGTRPVADDHPSAPVRRGATVLALPPLTAAAIDRLVGDGRGNEIAVLTGGNPLLVTELRRELDRGAGTTAAPEAAPASIARSVMRRVAAISEEARRLVHAASLFSIAAPLADVAAVAELDLLAAASAADALVRAQVFGPGEFVGFLHPVMRTAVYEQLGPFERRFGHARAAETLKARGADPAIVAAHLLAGEPAQDAGNMRILRAAAADAIASMAPRAAIRYLERALAEGVPTDVDEQVALLLELGRLQRETLHPAGRSTLERAFALSDGRALRPTAAIELAGWAHMNADFAAVQSVVAAMAGQPMEPDERLALDMLRAVAAWLTRDFPAYFALIDQLPDDLTNDTPARAVAAAERAIARFLRGETPRSVCAAELRQVAEGPVEPRIAGIDLADPSTYLALTEQFDLAERLTTTRHEHARMAGNVEAMADSAWQVAWLRHLRGDVRGAEALFREMRDLRGLADFHRVGLTMGVIEVLDLRGAVDEMERELAAVAPLADGAFMLGWIAEQRAVLAVRRGDFGAALPAFEERWTRNRPQGLRHPLMCLWAVDYADALVGTGSVDAGVGIVRSLLEHSERLGSAWGEGVFATALGRLTRDRPLLERAWTVLAPTPLRWAAARARLELGVILLGTDHDAAGRHLRAVLDYAEANGVDHFAKRARSALEGTVEQTRVHP